MPLDRFLLQNDPILVSDLGEVEGKVYLLPQMANGAVKAVRVTFQKARLARLEIQYSSDFARTVDWFVLVSRFSKLYGPCRYQQDDTPSQFVSTVSWKDDSTFLDVRHEWTVDRKRAEMNSRYTVSYRDSLAELPAFPEAQTFAAKPR